MTALSAADLVGSYDTDAGLAVATARGDRAALAVIYDRYADRLYDYCWRMLRDRDSAADCVQDVFCTAATRMAQLRDPDRLRPWLYSIAKSEALRRVRDRDRETVADELPDAASDDPTPETVAARGELADLVSDAAGGLSDRDRSVLELAYRHGLAGADLAEALGVTQVNANTIVHRLRDTVERSLGALLVSRGVRLDPDRCAELAGILDGWDGTFTVLMRKRVGRHIEACATCDEERRRLVNPVALLGAAPVFVPAPAWLREHTLAEVELTTSARPDADGSGRGSSKLPAALFVAALIAAFGLTVVWLNQDTTTVVEPVRVDETVAPPVPVKPPPPTPTVKAPPAPVLPSTKAPVVRPTLAPVPLPRPTVRPPQPPPPVVEEPANPVPPAQPPQPPPPPPPPPLQWPPQWELPDWELPQWPQWPPSPPPGGGRLTGPPDLGIDPPRPLPPQ